MLADRYFGFPPLYEKANKVLQRWRILAFYGIASCLRANKISVTLISTVNSGAPAARRAAKRSPISIPYMEIEGNPWIDFLMVIKARGIARGRGSTTAATTVESCNMTAMLLQRNAPSVCSGSGPSFLCGIFKEKKTNVSGGWSNVLHWKKNQQKARINRRRIRERKSWASAGEVGETVLNNVANSESGIREGRWNIYIERRRNTCQIDSDDYRLSEV